MADISQNAHKDGRFSSVFIALCGSLDDLSSPPTRTHASPTFTIIMVAEKKKSGGTSRGAVAKRRSAARTDKDGDLVMESSSRGRGGVSKGRSSTQTGRGKTSKPARAGLNSETFQRQVLKHVASGEASGSGRISRINSNSSSLLRPSWVLVAINLLGYAQDQLKSSESPGGHRAKLRPTAMAASPRLLPGWRRRRR